MPPCGSGPKKFWRKEPRRIKKSSELRPEGNLIKDLWRWKQCMGAMSGAGMPQLGHVRLVDLMAADGLPSDAYKLAVNSLAESLARFNMVVVQLPPGHEVLLRCVLDSVRMFFHQRPVPGVESVHADDPADWNRTVGYYSEPHHVRELYDYRPGRSPAEASNGPELPPAGLPELFSALGTATRTVLDAIGCSMDLRSFCFNDLLDNVPLKAGEVSTSVLSSCCYGRPGAHHSGGVSLPDQPHMPLFDDHEPHAEKGLLTLMKSDKPGLHIRDVNGRWILADGDLGPQDMVLFSGLSLYQATAGYLSPALHRTEISPAHSQMYGRCTVAFKLMPRATAILHCSAMTAAEHAVSGPFIVPIGVQDFMQRPHPMDQLVTRTGLPSFSFPAPTESQRLETSLLGDTSAFKPNLVPFAADPALKTGTMNKRRKQGSRGKPLAPSKRLRLEAQRVLKERVQEIADSKGLKIRFCNFKDCEEQHINSLDSPCAVMRSEMGWPAGVPFVHPHDLPNKAKQAFLEAYEPGWTAAQDGELGLLESGHAHHSMHALTGAPLLEDPRFAVRTVYDYLRAKGKPVPTGKPQVVGHKVDLSGLAKACYDAGGRAQVLVCHCSSPYTKVLRVVQGFLEMMASVKMVVKLKTQVWGQQDHLYLSVQCSHASWAAEVGFLSELVSAGWIRFLIHVNNNARTSELKIFQLDLKFVSSPASKLPSLVSFTSGSVHLIRDFFFTVVLNSPSLPFFAVAHGFYPAAHLHFVAHATKLNFI